MAKKNQSQETVLLDKQAKSEVINNTMVAQVMNQKYGKIVRTIAQQFTNNPNDQQDLMQEGYIGLIEAAKRYDPSTGVQFESYASW